MAAGFPQGREGSFWQKELQSGCGPHCEAFENTEHLLLCKNLKVVNNQAETKSVTSYLPASEGQSRQGSSNEFLGLPEIFAP